jgi:hypothetical protein
MSWLKPRPTKISEWAHSCEASPEKQVPHPLSRARDDTRVVLSTAKLRPSVKRMYCDELAHDDGRGIRNASKLLIGGGGAFAQVIPERVAGAADGSEND